MLDLYDLNKPYECRDRWNFDVHFIHSGETFSHRPEGTCYLMMSDCRYWTPKGQIDADALAVQTTNQFEIDPGLHGTAVVIEFPGLSMNEDRIYIPDSLGEGNLSYMDGGTNTTAINPGRLGDPVINYVHFPAKMYQTLHTHPSQRIGFVLRGNGRILLKDDEEFKLHTGHCFFMQRNELHNFVCDDEDVVLFVWAPDSGTGPTDEINPLKVRTYVKQTAT